MEAIQTKDLTKRYKQITALSGVEVTVPQGEIYGFLGPNGAGKTTTIRLILNLINPTEGSVHVLGEKAQESLHKVLPKIGTVLGDPAFYPHLSGRENLRLFSDLLTGEDHLSVEEGLRLAGLEKKANLKFSNFSAGMRRRLALGSAYIKDPELYILDEPTSGLDPKGRMDVRETIKNLDSEGKTVFLSSHLLNEVQKLCTKVGILQEGLLIDESSVSRLTKKTKGVTVTSEEKYLDQVKEVLEKLDYVKGIDLTGEKAFVDCPADKSSQILSKLTEEDIPVQEIEKQARSLEDVFMELTEGEQKDE